jgi:hypothetical protein
MRRGHNPRTRGLVLPPLSRDSQRQALAPSIAPCRTQATQERARIRVTEKQENKEISEDEHGRGARARPQPASKG